MPEPVTFATPDGKPNEERRKVSSLTAAPAPPPPPVEQITHEPAAPAAPAAPRQLVLFVRLRAIVATTGRYLSQLMRLVRAVPGAPRTARQFATTRMHAGIERVMSPLRRLLSHRRTWLTVAWSISALSCALLFSVALEAPLAASLLVVASVAIFSGLTTALTMHASERQGRSADEHPQRRNHPDELRDPGLVTSTEHSAQPAEVVGSHPAR
jgi:hypothetical protein